MERLVGGGDDPVLAEKGTMRINGKRYKNTSIPVP
jgi:hypothetical protein